MKNLARIVFAGTTLLAATTANATWVTLSFDGTISAVTRPGFETLLGVGDPVVGSFSFDWSPPPIYWADSPIYGAYEVPAGSVSSVRYNQAGLGFPGLMVFWDGLGPSSVTGGVKRTLTGVWFTMDVNGDTATLSDYLALKPNDFAIVLTGLIDPDPEGTKTQTWVANVNITQAGFSLGSPIPESTNTANLLLASLMGIVLYQMRCPRRSSINDVKRPWNVGVA